MTNIVHNIDCMEGMKEYPDKYFDLAVVDPPYGIGANKMTLGNGKKKINRGSRDWDNKIPDIEYWDQLYRVSINQVVWGANYMIKHLKENGSWIFWDKGTGNNDFSDGELAWTSFDGALRKISKTWVGNNAKDGHIRIHPTQKPIYLYEWLIVKYCKPGMKILDTHVGSGSSRIAADKHGMDFIGYELDADYWKAQEKRYAEYKAQLKLF